MTRFFLVAILCLLGLSGLRADQSAPVTDPALVAQHYRQVVQRDQFQETDEPALNSRFGEWLSDWFRRLGSEFGDFKYASRMPAFESLLMTLLIVSCITVLLYVMARLRRRREHLELEPETASDNPQVWRAPEFYDEEIEAAVRSNDWHTAWLASWRQFLSRLERGHLVAADRTRTNREYLLQLREKSLPASASALLAGMVDAYDHSIYGRKAIGELEWDLFRQQIDQAVLLLHLDGRRESGKGGAS